MNKIFSSVKENWLNYLTLFLLVIMVFGVFFGGFNASLSSKSLDVGRQSMNYYSSKADFDSVQEGGSVVERKIIKNGAIDLESDSYDLAKKNILKVSEDFSVIVLKNDENRDRNGYRRLFLNVKVESSKIEEYMDSLKKFGEVDDFDIYSADVTESFMDYSERILRYEGQLDKYVLMLEKPSLEIEDEIRIQERIDDLEDSLFYLKKNFGDLKEKVVYSDVRVTLNEEKGLLDEIDFIDVDSGFRGFMESLGAAIWILVYVGGFVLPFGLVFGIYFLIRKIFK